MPQSSNYLKRRSALERRCGHAFEGYHCPSSCGIQGRCEALSHAEAPNCGFTTDRTGPTREVGLPVTIRSRRFHFFEGFWPVVTDEQGLNHPHQKMCATNLPRQKNKPPKLAAVSK